MDKIEGSPGTMRSAADIVLLRLGIAAELVEHGALRVEDAPVRIVRGMRAGQHIERLVVVAGLGQGAAVGAEQLHVMRVADGRLLQHGDGLGALVGGAQRAGIGDGRVGVVGIFAVMRAPDIKRTPPFGVGARRFRAR